MQTSPCPRLRPVDPGPASMLERRVHRVLRRGGHAVAGAVSGMAAEPTASYATAAEGVACEELSRPQARLAEFADLAQQVDQTVARMIWLLADLQASDEVEVPLPMWLGQVARRTGTAIRMLQTAADVLPTLPATFLAFREGRLSWSQVRSIVLAAKRVPLAGRSELDGHLARVVDEARSWMPGDLVSLVDEHVARLRPSDLERAEKRREQGQFLAMQPDLFGGGRIWGELDTIGFATIAEALDPTLAELQAAARDGEPIWKSRSRVRAARLVDLCDAALAGGTQDQPGARTGRPQLSIHVDLDTLLDRDQVPGWLLHTLTGGRMKISGPAIRRLVDERGADIRTIVFDDTGHALGVGRRTRRPPGWLRDAVEAMYLADAAPGSDTAVRLADLDHDEPFRDDGTGGATDVEHLHPVGRPMHVGKTPVDGSPPDWIVTRNRDGTRTWGHRTGRPPPSTVHAAASTTPPDTVGPSGCPSIRRRGSGGSLPSIGRGHRRADGAHVPGLRGGVGRTPPLVCALRGGPRPHHVGGAQSRAVRPAAVADGARGRRRSRGRRLGGADGPAARSE